MVTYEIMMKGVAAQLNNIGVELQEIGEFDYACEVYNDSVLALKELLEKEEGDERTQEGDSLNTNTIEWVSRLEQRTRHARELIRCRSTRDMGMLCPARRAEQSKDPKQCAQRRPSMHFDRLSMPIRFLHGSVTCSKAMAVLVMHNLALVNMEMKEHVRAKTFFAMNLDVLHPETCETILEGFAYVSSHYFMALLLQEDGLEEQAFKHLCEAYFSGRELLGDRSLIASILGSIGTSLLRQGIIGEARATFMEAQRICRRESIGVCQSAANDETAKAAPAA